MASDTNETKVTQPSGTHSTGKSESNISTEKSIIGKCSTVSENITCVDGGTVAIFAALAFYAVFLIVFRRYAILDVAKNRLISEIDKLRGELCEYVLENKQCGTVSKTGSAADPDKEELDRIANKAIGDLREIEDELNGDGWYFMLIATGIITKGWRKLHKIKREFDYQFYGIVPTTAKLDEQLKLITFRLDELKTSFSLGTSKEINRILDEEKVTDASKEVTDASKKAEMKERKRFLLKEATKTYEDFRDAYFETLSDLNNKTMWLILTSFIFIVLIILFEKFPLLVVAGGIGGLLSKLRKIIGQPSESNDYGLSWGPIFLSPLVGSITGWAGVYIVLFLAKVGTFSQSLVETLDMEGGCYKPALLIIALVFGYSAGLFEKMIGKFESYAIEERKKVS